jgi:hypothetical protein
MATLKKTHTDKPKRKFMAGTQGNPYLPFARQGNVLLGVRLQSITSGDYFGAADTTYFTLRLRSAPENGLFAEEDKAKKVVKLAKNPENLWDAWPGVVWEKKDISRASTTVGVFERGMFKSKDPASLKTLLSAIDDGKLAEKFADHLISLAGEKNLICRRSELTAFLDEGLKPVIAGVVEKLQKQEAFADHVLSTIGTVAMHAALIKKVFGDKPVDPEAAEHEEAEIADIEGDQE